MRIDSPLQGYSAERSPRPGAASTALRDSQREVELRGEVPASPSASQGFEALPQPRKVQASSAGSENLPARSQAYAYQQPVGGRVGQALASYTSTANLVRDTDAPEVLGLDLYA